MTVEPRPLNMPGGEHRSDRRTAMQRSRTAGGWGRIAGFGIVVTVVFCAPAATFGNNPPAVSIMPTVSSATVVADSATAYTVTMTASDADGYNDLRSLRVLFDFTEANPDQSLGRASMSWGASDGDITPCGGVGTLADATGGGRWGYRTDAWGGTTYITPTATSSDVTLNLGFTLVMEDSEVTLLIIEIVPVPPVDFDRDRDVDQSDIGRFQACLTGPAQPQNAFDCRDARLDGDGDADKNDFLIFLACMSGANTPADPARAD